MDKSEKRNDRKGWFKAFLSGFLATVLGIVLTFGTTRLIENKREKEMARMIVKSDVMNLISARNYIQSGYEYLSMIDSLNETCVNHYKEYRNLDALPDTVVGGFYGNITNTSIASATPSVWLSDGKDDLLQRVLGDMDYTVFITDAKMHTLFFDDFLTVVKKDIDIISDKLFYKVPKKTDTGATLYEAASLIMEEPQFYVYRFHMKRFLQNDYDFYMEEIENDIATIENYIDQSKLFAQPIDEIIQEEESQEEKN